MELPTFIFIQDQPVGVGGGGENYCYFSGVRNKWKDLQFYVTSDRRFVYHNTNTNIIRTVARIKTARPPKSSINALGKDVMGTGYGMEAGMSET